MDLTDFSLIRVTAFISLITGYLFLTRAMNENLCRNTPIIAFTALQVREMLLAHGLSDYLSKPVDMELMELMMLTYLPMEKIYSSKVAA